MLMANVRKASSELAADLTVGWHNYMQGDKASNFLNVLMNLRSSHRQPVEKRNFVYVVESVLSDFTATNDSMSVVQSSTNTTSKLSAETSTKAVNVIDPDVQVAAGCLRAISALYSKSRARESVQILLSASKGIGKRLEAFKSPADAAYLAEAWNHLLLHHHLQDGDSFLRASSNISSSLGSGAGPMSNHSPPHLPPFTLIPHSEYDTFDLKKTTMPADNLKYMTNLALKSFDVFPVLRDVQVPTQTVEAFLRNLIEAQLWSCSVNFVKLYPQSVSVTSLQLLTSALLQAGEFENAANLMCFARKKLTKSVYDYRRKEEIRLESAKFTVVPSESTKIGDTNTRKSYHQSVERTSMSFDAFGSTSSTLATTAPAATASPSFPGAPDPFPPPQVPTVVAAEFRSMTKLTKSEIEELVSSVLWQCMEAATVLSLRAATTVAQTYGYDEVEREIRSKAMISKLKTFVTKGKWQLALQVVKNNRDQAKLLFDCLMDEELFAEAESVYLEKNLQSLVINSVTEAQLQYQRDYNRRKYLLFPQEEVKIHVVDSWEKLQYAANALGISLELTYPKLLNSNTSSTRISSSSSSSSSNNKRSTAGSPRQKESKYLSLMELTTMLTDNYMKNDISSSSSSSSASSSQVSASPPPPPESTCTTTAAAVITGTALEPPPPSPSSLTPPYRLAVGMDAEWKVEMYSRNPHPVGCSIFQIATTEEVFILDFGALCAKEKNYTQTVGDDSVHFGSGSHRPSHTSGGMVPVIGGRGRGGRRDHAVNRPGKFSPYQRARTSNSDYHEQQAKNHVQQHQPHQQPHQQHPQPHQQHQQQHQPLQQQHQPLQQQQLRACTLRFLTNLFRDEGILKVGWAFMSEDAKVLRGSERGYFRPALEQINSYIDVCSAIGEISRWQAATAMTTAQKRSWRHNGGKIHNKHNDIRNTGKMTARAGINESTHSLPQPQSQSQSQQAPLDKLPLTEAGEDEGGGSMDVALEEEEEEEGGKGVLTGSGSVATSPCATVVEGKTAGQTAAATAAPNLASLSGACAVYLGKPLLKAQQISDWDQRPLSSEQLHYASLDAHATLALLDAALCTSLQLFNDTRNSTATTTTTTNAAITTLGSQQLLVENIGADDRIDTSSANSIASTLTSCGLGLVKRFYAHGNGSIGSSHLK